MDDLAAVHTTLYPRQPYTFAHALSYCTRRSGERVDRVVSGAYARLFSTDDGLVLARVAASADGLGLTLTRTVQDEPLRMVSGGAAAAIEASLRRTLGLDDDLEPFRRHVAGDQPLAGLIERYAGLRLVSTPSAFEAFVWAVIGQQISLHVAFRLKAALVERYGCRAAAEGTEYWTFPSPAKLAEADPAALAALGLGRRKAETIVRTAAAVASGGLDLQALAGRPLVDSVATLTALHGVGPWTAHYTLLRGLRCADAFPASDMGLRDACGMLYHAGRRASVDEVERHGQRWTPFRGYAAFFLWFMLADASNLVAAR